MRVRDVLHGALYACAVLLSAAAPSSPALEVRLRLEPDSIVLGQPVWVAVDMTNRTANTVTAEGATSCFTTALRIEIPTAPRLYAQPEQCAHRMQNCLTEVVDVAPGQTITRRFVLRGDFRVTGPGNYGVVLHEALRYGVAGEPNLDRTQNAALNAMLAVLPANPQQLLTIEKSLAQQATDVSAARDATMHRYALAQGLATYPAAGMEPIFTTWLDRQDFYEYGLSALYHLNTAQARAILAQRAAEPSAKLPQTENQIARWLAVDYLSKMRDRAYVPLLEKLVHDPIHDVRRMAVLGVGRLGADQGLPLLASLARDGNTLQDRIDAIQAIGETASPGGVPLLIDLFSLPNADQKGPLNNALYELTHHEIPGVWNAQPAKAQHLWQAWWAQNHSTARIYAPVTCDM